MLSPIVHVTKNGQHSAKSDLDADVYPGALSSILGPKSTLCRPALYCVPDAS